MELPQRGVVVESPQHWLVFNTVLWVVLIALCALPWIMSLWGRWRLPPHGWRRHMVLWLTVCQLTLTLCVAVSLYHSWFHPALGTMRA